LTKPLWLYWQRDQDSPCTVDYMLGQPIQGSAGECLSSVTMNCSLYLKHCGPNHPYSEML
jgi:hypothetical protein